MVQLHNFFFFITSVVVSRGTTTPVLLKWFVNRNVPTCALFSNGTIIPILIPSFPLLVYLHSRKFIRSADGAKSGVLIRASHPILLPDIIGRSSSPKVTNIFIIYIIITNIARRLFFFEKKPMPYLETDFTATSS
ncbi:hypothetical protein RDI58_016555 [Solanum bulbocastanum]|uniref:Uncharacterized protein n=1 Tax=Solanum bulbocastanum TaxID=147425 RepID=A0AAN8THP9_SOLBU